MRKRVTAGEAQQLVNEQAKAMGQAMAAVILSERKRNRWIWLGIVAAAVLGIVF